jgi:hypothetical protein
LSGATKSPTQRSAMAIAIVLHNQLTQSLTAKKSRLANVA